MVGNNLKGELDDLFHVNVVPGADNSFGIMIRLEFEIRKPLLRYHKEKLGWMKEDLMNTTTIPARIHDTQNIVQSGLLDGVFGGNSDLE